MVSSKQPMNATSSFSTLLFCLLAPLLMAEPASRLTVGATAPDFTLPNLAGEEVTLSNVTSMDKVVLVFLRGWNGYQCPACSRQTAGYLASAEAFAQQGYQLIFIYPNHGDAPETQAKATEFAANYDFPDHFHFLTDSGVLAGKSFQLFWDAPRETVYPAFYLLDKERKVTFADVSRSHGGRVTAEQALAAIASL